MAEVNPIDASKLSERELLLILHERVGTISREMHDLKDGYERRLSTVEAKLEHLQEIKADKGAVDNAFEKIAVTNAERTKQINTINLRLAFFAGGLAIINIVVPILLKYGLPH